MSDSDKAQSGRRGDAFGPERKQLFLFALRKGEPVLEACRTVGVSNRTAYNHRQRDPDFASQWNLALQMHQWPLDLAAYQRGVIGVEEPVYAYGKLCHVRVRRSDALFRKVLEAEKPRKYGRGAGLRAERDRIDNRIEKRVAAETRALRALVLTLTERIEALEARAVKVVNPLPEGGSGPPLCGISPLPCSS